MADIKNVELLTKIGLVLKELRTKKGLTQADVIADTGIHAGKLETAVSNMSVSTIYQLAEYFEIKLSDFFKLVEKQK
jgi:transcriptional regulator with XRE-family HTH domain